MEKIIAMSGLGPDKYAKDLDERGKNASVEYMYTHTSSVPSNIQFMF